MESPNKPTEISHPQPPPVGVYLPEEDTALEQKFQRLAEQWRRETRYVSSIIKRSMHPAYQKIIGMGLAALPFILRDLEQTRDHWLWALYVITEEDPAPEEATFDEVVEAWLDWGQQRGYLA